MTRLSRFALTLGVAFSLAGAAVLAQTDDAPKTGFIDYVYKGSEAKDGESKYVVFVPHDYKADKEYPCILFLHGSGESGADGKKQTKVGLGKAVKGAREELPLYHHLPAIQSARLGRQFRTR